MIFVLDFAFVVVTCFISSFTSTLTQLGITSSTTNAQFMKLHKYMRQHSISPKLCARITQNAKCVLYEKHLKTPEEDVELLKLISEPLRKDLHHEIYACILEGHPVFKTLNLLNVSTMKLICHRAVSICHFSKGDVLFSPGEIPLRPDFLMLYNGECEYTCADNDALFLHKYHVTVTPMTWLNEPALWTSWIYRGMLQTTMESQILVVSGEELMEISAMPSHFDFSAYARIYVENLNLIVCTDLACEIDSATLVEKVYDRSGPCRRVSLREGLIHLPKSARGVMRIINRLRGNNSDERVGQSPL